jgi:glyoxylase-like metal-dependent hydrolase (beta-lactamase superfamily II)
LQIGKYKIQALETAKFALDGGAMFGIIPKPLWQKNNPADIVNRVTLSARCLLLEGDKRKILVDTGLGNKWDEKAKSIYNIEQNDIGITSSLNQIGISPDEITDVILTHLHFDHSGGSTKLDGGKIIPTFPNAIYYVRKKNFDWAISPSERDKGSYLKENFEPLAKEGVFNFLNDDGNFNDEISMINVNGHTFGQQLIKISDSGTTLLYCGDLLPFSSHIHLPYIMGYDLQPLITLEEKKKILSEAAEGNWLLVFEHDPFIQGAIVQRTEKSFSIKESIKLL